MICAFART